MTEQLNWTELNYCVNNLHSLHVLQSNLVKETASASSQRAVQGIFNEIFSEHPSYTSCYCLLDLQKEKMNLLIRCSGLCGFHRQHIFSKSTLALEPILHYSCVAFIFFTLLAAINFLHIYYWSIGPHLPERKDCFTHDLRFCLNLAC